jgi:hypothetical protein
MTSLQLEVDTYEKMIIADVNNYIAVHKNGKVKCKGRFEWEDLEKKKVAMFHKNKSFLIIPKAIYAYFVDGVMPEDFLAQNQNIFDYCGAVKAKGDWHFVERKLVDGNLINNKLQKIIRYYISNDGSKLVKCNSDGREIQVEAGQWMQSTVNNLSADKKEFKEYDINLAYYIESIYKEITQIQKARPMGYSQLLLF